MQRGYSTVIFILLFLIVVFIVGMGFYLGGLTNNYFQKANLDNLTATPTPSVSDLADPKLCAQVITPAKNLETGECKDFPTPCGVPSGWERVDSCNLEINSFDECVEAGNRVLKTYPEQCLTPDGKKFIQKVSD